MPYAQVQLALEPLALNVSIEISDRRARLCQLVLKHGSMLFNLRNTSQGFFLGEVLQLGHLPL